jgi:hypothetical protein
MNQKVKDLQKQVATLTKENERLQSIIEGFDKKPKPAEKPIEKPAKIYPNISFEASILIKSKQRAVIIPRNYLLNDSSVVMANGDTVKVKIGLKDYQMVEIISGISIDDQLKKP